MLLVTVDTLRADRLGCYGGKSPATPAYDRLAREGALFENAVATNPLTLPAHTSILTGRYPTQHGVRGNGNFAVPASEQTLAQLLHDAGFDTGAFIGAFPLASRFGIGRGFKVYNEDFGFTISPSGAQVARSGRRAREVNAAALPWLQGAKGSRFFLWIHYFDPHFEYVPEEPFASRYPGAPYDGEVAETDAALGELLDALDRLGLAKTTLVVVIADHGEGLGQHGEAFHGFFLYDTTIRVPFLLRAPGAAAAGARIAQAVSGADVAPTILALLGRPVPAAMSGRSLTPLFAGGSGASPESAQHGAGSGGSPSADASVSDRTRSTANPPPSDGVKSPESASFELGVVCESYGPWFEFKWSPLWGLRTPAWKFIEGPEPELYDLRADPGETTNLAARRGELVTSARAALVAMRARHAPEPASGAGRSGEPLGGASRGAGREAARDAGAAAARGVSAEEAERLRSLGYAASGAAPSTANLPSPGGGLRDPKSMTGFEEAYYRAFALVNAGRNEEAIAAYKALEARDPRAPMVRYQLGRTLRRTKQYDQAQKELQEALRLAPDLAEAAFDIALVREDQGDAAGAETWIRKALAINAAYPEAHAALARLRFRAGDRDGARAEMQRAVALAPTDPMYRKALESLGAGAPR